MSVVDPFKVLPGMRLATAPGLRSPPSPRTPTPRARPEDKRPQPQRRSPYDLTPQSDRARRRSSSSSSNTANSGGGGAAGRQRRHISFKLGANSLSFVEPPPKSESPQYWFTERERKVRKPLFFSVESNTAVSVQVAVGMRITAIRAESAAAAAADEVPKKRVRKGKGAGDGASSAAEESLSAAGSSSSSSPPMMHQQPLQLPSAAMHRTFFDVKQRMSLSSGQHTLSGLMSASAGAAGSGKPPSWSCVASSAGTLEKTKVYLHPGLYLLRARGPSDLHIFGEVIDIDRELI